MADLGAIGNYRRTGQARTLNVWAAGAAKGVPKPNSVLPWTRTQNFWRHANCQGVIFRNDGTISGVVRENGTPIPNAIVRLYYRPNGVFIGGARTDASGIFTFKGLDPSDSANYYAIAFDPDGGVQYNALIFDRLTAVGTAAARTISPSGWDSLIFQAPHDVGPTIYYDSVVLADNPVGYWQMNETTGSIVYDYSQSGLHGTVAAGVTKGAAQLRKNSGASMSFPGTAGNVVSIPANAVLNNLTAGGSWSIEAWFSPSADGGGVMGAIVQRWYKEFSGHFQFLLALNNQATTKRRLLGDYSGSDDNHGQLSAYAAITSEPLNIPCHVVYKKAGGTVSIYKNGTLMRSKSVTLNPQVSAGAPLTIGGSSNYGSYAFPGSISDVAIYNYALSDAQVANHYTYGALP